jgi:hypothetical protein
VFHDEPVGMKFFGQTPAYAGVTTMILISLGGPKGHVHSE